MEVNATDPPLPDEKWDDAYFDITIDPTLLQDDFFTVTKMMMVAHQVKKMGLMMIIHVNTLSTFEISQI